ncbi:MAG: hypothetical protein C4329_04725 [Chitinophagaceae bacterium]
MGGITGAYSQVLASWGFTGDDRTAFMAPIAISNSTPTTLYVASDNLHKSTDNGSTWTNSALSSSNYIEAQFKTGIAIGVSPLNANNVYVSTSPFSQRKDNSLNVTGQPNLMRSLNGGTSFASIKNSLPDRFVMDFAFSPTNDDSLFVVLGGYGTSHVYVTGNAKAVTPASVTWASRGTGLFRLMPLFLILLIQILFMLPAT